MSDLPSDASVDPLERRRTAQRSLRLGCVVSLAVALLGLAAYALSGSDALLLESRWARVQAE